MKNKFIPGFIILGLGLIAVSLFLPNQKGLVFFDKNIATVVHVNGTAQIESADQITPIPVEKNTKISNLDTIRTNEKSDIQIQILPFKAEIRVSEQSILFFEKLKNGQLILTVKEGQVEIENLGQINVSSNSSDSDSSVKNSETFWIRKDGRQLSAMDYYISYQNNSDSQNARKLKGELFAQNNNEVISQSKIEEILNSRKNDFFRCYGQLIQKSEPSHGQVLLSFEISPNGKVQKVEVSKTEIQSATFLSCLKEIVLRTKFPTFSGASITTVFPLNFE